MTGGHDGVPPTRNEQSGNVVHGPNVQAGQIHGGITFVVQPPPAPGPRARPDQVPPLTVRFVNRRADLAALDHWSAGLGAAGLVGVGVLRGLPGVGKTATARRWAHEARDRFPDGQLFADFAELRDRAGGDVSEALRAFLTGLGVSDACMPDSLAGRSELYRQRSRGRRLLVVLDDVDQPAQVRALIPAGPGSAVLVTSHGTLGELIALDGARPLPVEPLDPDSGLRVLADRLGLGPDAVEAERPALERLVELCAGLPVALHVVAARLLTEPHLTATALAAELADERRRLAAMSLPGDHSVSAVLTTAYAQLPADAARLYRLLGSLPGRTFDLGTAAAAAGLAPDDTGTLLATVHQAGLLETTPDRRYRFHDLVRLHAREQARRHEPPEAERELTARVATHYLALTALADRAVRADRLRVADLDGLLRDAPDPFAEPGGPAPLDWLEAERANILAVLRATARHGLHTVTWQLAEAFTVLFLHHRHLGDWRESLELGARAAAEDVAPAAEARLRSMLSRPLMDLAEYDRARAELRTATACADAAGNTELAASVREFTGRYWDRFDPAKAVDAYRESLELNLRAGQARGAAIARYFLGCAQDAGGDPRTALETLRAARDGLLARDDLRMAARVTAAIGTAHDHLGETAEAVRALDEAARTLREQRATHYEAQALTALADLLERTGGDRRTLLAALRRAHEILHEGGSPQAPALRARLDRLTGDDYPGD
ncbi:MULTISPECIES: NB-ARC domain-containing protein [Streptomycetaceae]|uniref:NB-ARC domain-containing protein n=1 Tax=Streptantibioticus cattleyicolor (strain ATCC 35852 / DSM 46488 / JCM 4925 / NBRC 14057 / NRRL 8057) TaxID=1003195 RepID=F8JX75_STREN|nr:MULTISPECIES: NB-ARC domain-containing protein [Streptomycetaceae]AEW94540.1 hypothetical protein SCATT_21690 [Streptantibioticus cattleyicolor NRRL 8057 = DSM 46488]MYS59180.1 hypothetical protein [Streptomyces sp. SID5468]CCB74899.1 conserved protein of unknown function [Streptantibioticus cattleyicolor NRRL 8057 = DSM 46488]